MDAIRQALGDTLFYGAFSPLLKIVVLLFLGILPLITYLVLAERKILGYMQARVGPNRVGPWGILQPIADVMKLLVKEDNIPNQAVKWAFILAPCLVVAPAFIIFAVIPVGPRADEGAGPLNWFITDVHAGLLFVIALGTIGVYGLIIGGWMAPFPNLMPFLGVIPGPIWFALKVFVFLFVYIWFRGTFPRYRFDQLMDLGWKVMLPLSLLNIFATGVLIYIGVI